jgi:hypothetical protein
MAAGEGLSALADLRARHEAVKQETHVDLDIPGYGGELVCRYVVMPWTENERLLKKGARTEEYDGQVLDAMCDRLIAACKEFLVRQDGKLVPLDDTKPVRYEPRLAEALNVDPGDPPDTRTILKGVFALPQPDEQRVPYVISGHDDEYLAWLTGGIERADEEFQGE